ncbi:MAG: hypothetical protein ACRC4W_07190 [Treponemataceae bacterium]
MTAIDSKKPYIFGFFTTCLFWIATAGVLFIIPLQKAIKAEKKYAQIKIVLSDIPFDLPLTPIKSQNEEEKIEQISPSQEDFLAALQSASNFPPEVDKENDLSSVTNDRQEIKKATTITKKPRETEIKAKPSNASTSIPLTKIEKAIPVQPIFTPQPTATPEIVKEKISPEADITQNSIQQENQQTQITGVAITTSEGASAAPTTEDDHASKSLPIDVMISQQTTKTFFSQSHNLSYQISGFLTQHNSNSAVLRMTDGSIRKLINPAEPHLALSEDTASQIEQSITTTIRFRILATGTISASNLQLDSNSALSPEIQTEIRSKLLEWQFEPSASFTQGSFQYKISK